MPKHTRFIQIVMAAIAAATAVVFVTTTPAGAQGGSNPPWFPSLMAFEHYDSGRTKLFEHANFTGSFARDNVVDVHISLDGYPTPYNVVYLSGTSSSFTEAPTVTKVGQGRLSRGSIRRRCKPCGLTS